MNEPTAATVSRVSCIHGVEDGCPRCRAMRDIHNWSVKELTRFMCTDEVTPVTQIALDIFKEVAP